MSRLLDIITPQAPQKLFVTSWVLIFNRAMSLNPQFRIELVWFPSVFLFLDRCA